MKKIWVVVILLSIMGCQTIPSIPINKTNKRTKVIKENIDETLTKNERVLITAFTINGFDIYVIYSSFVRYKSSVERFSLEGFFEYLIAENENNYQLIMADKKKGQVLTNPVFKRLLAKVKDNYEKMLIWE